MATMGTATLTSLQGGLKQKPSLNWRHSPALVQSAMSGQYDRKSKRKSCSWRRYRGCPMHHVALQRITAAGIASTSWAARTEHAPGRWSVWVQKLFPPVVTERRLHLWYHSLRSGCRVRGVWLQSSASWSLQVRVISFGSSGGYHRSRQCSSGEVATAAPNTTRCAPIWHWCCLAVATGVTRVSGSRYDQVPHCSHHSLWRLVALLRVHSAAWLKNKPEVAHQMLDTGPYACCQSAQPSVQV